MRLAVPVGELPGPGSGLVLEAAHRPGRHEHLLALVLQERIGAEAALAALVLLEEGGHVVGRQRVLVAAGGGALQPVVRRLGALPEGRQVVGFAGGPVQLRHRLGAEVEAGLGRGRGREVVLADELEVVPAGSGVSVG